MNPIAFSTNKRFGEEDLKINDSNKKQKIESVLKLIQDVETCEGSRSLENGKITTISNDPRITEIFKTTKELLSDKMEMEENEILFLPEELFKKLDGVIKKGLNAIIPDLFSPLFKCPKHLKLFIEFLIPKNSNYCLLLLKEAYRQKNPAVFILIIDQIARLAPELLSNTHYQNILENVFNQQEWSDLRCEIICIDETVNVFIIKSLFQSKSKFFQTMFDSSYKEASSPDITLQWDIFGIDSRLAIKVLEFFYNGKINYDQEFDDVIKCMSCADSLDIPILKNLYEQWVLEHPEIDEDKFEEIYQAGEICNSNKLKQRALNLAAIQFVLIRSSSSIEINASQKGSIKEKIQNFIYKKWKEIEVLSFNCSKYNLCPVDSQQILISIVNFFPHINQLTFVSNSHPDFSILADLKSLEGLSLELPVTETEEEEKSLTTLSFIGKLTSLKSLNLNSCINPDILFGYLTSLINLENLHIQFGNKNYPNYNYLNIIFPPNIKHLVIKGPQELKVKPDINILKKLETLQVPWEWMDRMEEIDAINKLERLTNLNLLNLKSKGCNKINLHLKVLNLQKNTPFMGSFMPNLKNFIYLNTLNIDRVFLGGEKKFLNYLGKIPIENLNTTGDLYLINSWIKTLIKALERRDKLDQILTFSTVFAYDLTNKLNRDDIHKLLFEICKLKKLKKLNLSTSKDVFNEVIDHDNLSKLSNLEELVLKSLPISPDLLKNINLFFSCLKLGDVQLTDGTRYIYKYGYWTVIGTSSTDFNLGFKLKISQLLLNFSKKSTEQIKKSILNIVNNHDLTCLRTLGITFPINASLDDSKDLESLLSNVCNLKNLSIISSAKNNNLFELIGGQNSLEKLSIVLDDIEDYDQLDPLSKLENLLSLRIDLQEKKEILLPKFSFTKKMPSLRRVALNGMDVLPKLRSQL